jgi:SSS family solute:Na+ symporter
MPWVAVFIGGLWIPHIFYWGFNQFITQRTLGAKNLHEGQKGILFGATLKLLIPFIVVFPGIIAFQLYRDEITNADGAYPYLIKQILPNGMIGVMFAALFGAVMSTLDSLLNSSATIFTMDIYLPFLKKDSSSSHLVKIGRIATFLLVIVGCMWAPVVGSFEKGIYFFIQQFWGFIQPGVVAAFLFGILSTKVPPKAAFGGMLLNFPIYGLLLLFLPEVAFLHHMAITFILIAIFIVIYTLKYPFQEVKILPEKYKVTSAVSTTVKIWGLLIFLATLTLYIIFY